MASSLGDTIALIARPRYEGANIRTWIGFKQFMYLLEEAVLQWFREYGWGPQRLYHELGLGLEVVDASAVLPSLLEADDEVVAEVAQTRPGRFSVRLSVSRGNAVTVLRGNAVVALVRETEARRAVPAELMPLVVPGVAAATTATRGDIELAVGQDVESALTARGSRPLIWSWPVRYFHCHFSDRVQHSAYVRALEEVVDRFLADRGLSIPRLLDERGWIPVVSRVRVQLVADAHMEEVIHTAFAVDEVLKRAAYDATMECWVERDGTLVHTATAKILHGYAYSRGEHAGRLVELDDATVAALTGQMQQ
jgi:acyl-CoA thioesterase FadM